MRRLKQSNEAAEFALPFFSKTEGRYYDAHQQRSISTLNERP